jgi:hypothetical protein
LNDIERIISALEQQKSAIERALCALREITGSGTLPAGRDRQLPTAKKKRQMSAAGRERIAEGVRKRWAASRPREEGTTEEDSGEEVCDEIHRYGLSFPGILISAGTSKASDDQKQSD